MQKNTKMNKKDCEYPNCDKCTMQDCKMEQKDIIAMMKRRKYKNNPEPEKEKQKAYRDRMKSFFPHCDECSECVCVKKEKSNGLRRVCVNEMRLIEQKVSNSPLWCYKRKSKGDTDDNDSK